MLRSSREGRKQAARFHAGASHSDPIKTEDQPTWRKALARAHDKRKRRSMPTQSPTAVGDIRNTRQVSHDTMSTEDFDEAAHMLQRASHDPDAYTILVQDASPARRVADATANKSADGQHAAASAIHDLFAPSPPPSTDAGSTVPRTSISTDATAQSALLDIPASSTARPPTPSASESTNVTSSGDMPAAMQWSRETSLESHSQACASSISSPPSSRPPSETVQGVAGRGHRRQRSGSEHEWDPMSFDEATDQTEGLFDASQSSDPRHKSRSSSEDEEEEKAIVSLRARKPLSNNSPRQIEEGYALVVDRTPRVVSKSLRQVEAEESQSISPPRRPRKRSTTSRSSDVPTTPVSRADSTGPKKRMKNDIVSKARQTLSADSDVEKSVIASESQDALVNRSSSIAAAAVASSSKLSASESTAPKKARGRPKGATKQHILEKAPKASKRKSVLPKTPSAAADLTAALLKSLSLCTSASDSAYLRSLGLSKWEPDKGRDGKPLWKSKAFLTSGLYSNDHKVEEPETATKRKRSASTRRPRNRDATASKTTFGLKAEGAFPYPFDAGHWLMIGQRDFRLTYNYAQEIDGVREKVMQNRKPPPYKHISANRYVSRPKLRGEIMVCHCPPSGTCDESCVNRQTEYLCDPDHCPCGERCTNVQFGKRTPAKTKVKWCGERGFGMVTLEPIKEGAFIDEYRGEVISYNQMVWRVRDHYEATGNYYFLMYDAPAGEMLDGGLKGNITRFANHSCEPNCKIQKWIICGTDEHLTAEFQVGLFAGRDIAAGEELTYDYGWSAFSPKAEGEEGSGEPCHCGAATCSGVMGVKKGSAADRLAAAGKADKAKEKAEKASAGKSGPAAIGEVVKDKTKPALSLSNASSARAITTDEKKAVKVPDAILQCVPEQYRTSDMLMIPASLIKQVEEAFKANTATAQGTKRWHDAVDAMVEAHVKVVSSAGIGAAKKTGRTGAAAMPARYLRGLGPPVVAEKPRMRATAPKDKYVYGLAPTPLHLIDSDILPVVKGKRKRTSVIPFVSEPSGRPRGRNLSRAASTVSES